MAIDYVLSAPALNSGGYKMLQDFNFSSLQTIGGAFPGMTFWFHGRLYQVIQNRSGGALAQGDVVSLYYAAAARTGNLQAASTTAVLKTDDTLDAGLKGSETYPGYVDTTAGALATTDNMEQHEILANDSTANNSLITISKYMRELGPTYADATLGPEALSTTPDATYDYEVFCPWEVVKAQSNAVTTTIPQGTVITTSITNAYFGIIQIKGFSLTKVDGTVDVAAGSMLAVSNGTAGVLELWAPTTTAATLTQLLQGLAISGQIFGGFTDNATGLRGVMLMNPYAVYPNPTF